MWLLTLWCNLLVVVVYTLCLPYTRHTVLWKGVIWTDNMKHVSFYQNFKKKKADRSFTTISQTSEMMHCNSSKTSRISSEIVWRYAWSALDSIFIWYLPNLFEVASEQSKVKVTAVNSMTVLCVFYWTLFCRWTHTSLLILTSDIGSILGFLETWQTSPPRQPTFLLLSSTFLSGVIRGGEGDESSLKF